MEAFYLALLALGAFWLGACPFSVWVGRAVLGVDIREYGDGNPGAANVFRAGGRGYGLVALFLDVAKGAPFVFLAYSLFGLSEAAGLAVGLCAVMGHAFSPLLGFRGGKSVAVTFGVLLALPRPEMLLVFTLFVVLGALFIENDAWTVMLGPAGLLVFLLATGADSWERLFAVCLLLLLGLKHFHELRALPSFQGRLFHWLRSMRRAA
jgi:acyl phosphate:glycerol-3-phosphate acyltransferase